MTFCQTGCCGTNYILNIQLCTILLVPGDLRATLGAAVWLGMKSPVRRIVILFFTFRTHGECFHRGFGPVIGDGFDYGEPGSAVCTGDERVTKPSVRGIKEFVTAVPAESDIRRDAGISRGSCTAGKDGKFFRCSIKGDDPAFNGSYPGREAAARLLLS